MENILQNTKGTSNDRYIILSHKIEEAINLKSEDYFKHLELLNNALLSCDKFYMSLDIVISRLQMKICNIVQNQELQKICINELEDTKKDFDEKLKIHKHLISKKRQEIENTLLNELSKEKDKTPEEKTIKKRQRGRPKKNLKT